MDVHYFDNKHNEYSIKLPINAKLFEQYINQDGKEYYIIKVNGIHVLHNKLKPLVISNTDGLNKYAFFNFGTNVKIEDLPIDDHTKCMLKLKYTLSEKDVWHCYHI